jgi:hypothetical protein
LEGGKKDTGIPDQGIVTGRRIGLASAQMPQLQLPIFHEGTHLITPNLGYQREGREVVYVYGLMPVFNHTIDDVASFQMIVSQFYVNGAAKQVDLVKAFGINPLSLKRWVKKYREGGARAFYVEKRGRPRGSKKKSPVRQ